MGHELTVPDTDDLLIEMRKTAWDTGEEEYADTLLTRATDLFYMATGLVADPEDDTDLRIMKDGIVAMGHALYVQSRDKAAIYSPFSSERIGSYSYSKMAAAAQEGLKTGVEMFDLAVDYFAGLGSEASASLIAKEDVFLRPFDHDIPKERDVSLVGWDPSE